MNGLNCLMDAKSMSEEVQTHLDKDVFYKEFLQDY